MTESKETRIKQLVDELYELAHDDEMVDLSKLKLDVDSAFEDSPLAEYVAAHAAFLEGQGNPNDLLNNLTQTAQRVVADALKNQEPQQETTEEFVDRVVDTLDFGDNMEEYKDDFKENLLSAIKRVWGYGFAKFIVNLRDGMAQGSLVAGNEEITITVDDQEFTPEKKCVYGGMCDENGCCMEQPAYCGNMSCEAFCSCSPLAEQGEDLSKPEDRILRDITYLDGDKLDLMDDVRDYLNSKPRLAHYSDKELDMIRFYLKGLASEQDYDIDDMGRTALLLAWNNKK